MGIIITFQDMKRIALLSLSIMLTLALVQRNLPPRFHALAISRQAVMSLLSHLNRQLQQNVHSYCKGDRHMAAAPIPTGRQETSSIPQNVTSGHCARGIVAEEHIR